MCRSTSAKSAHRVTVENSQTEEKEPMMSDEQLDAKHETLITLHVCGGKQARRCVDGGEHDMSKLVRFTDGGSVACAKCGITAMQIDMMELP